MFNLQGSEIIVILLLALVVLGPEKLPDAIRRFSRTYAELKKMGSGFQSELKSALDEPVNEMRKTADMVRDAADPDKITADHEERTTVPPEPAADSAPAEAAAPAEPAEPAARAEPDPPQGDPPLVVGDETDSALPTAEAPRRINHIAAANSSGAIAASARAAADDGDTTPTPPSGPAFHSAGPRTLADLDQPDDECDGDIAVTGAAGVADESESSDEAATA